MKRYLRKLRKLEEKNLDKLRIKNLEKELTSYISSSKRWKNSYLDTFEKYIKLKSTVIRVFKKNKELKREIESLNNEIMELKYEIAELEEYKESYIE